ncbi:fluoride efflux transporter FluC [Streptomyces sp. NPDC090106]|uniref:fluoride efflux transporter FluC n=1 Tax=Streptomyces sp. NPDC090106 TaxID=3365946 RepID=UPI003812A079
MRAVDRQTEPAVDRQTEPAAPETAVEQRPAAHAPTPKRRQAEILAVIAAGGVLGACVRYGATLIWPTAPTAFPWTTLWTNVTGCAAMGVLMVLVTERFTVHPLTRPFLGTGVLGGYTTFSTATLDTQRLLDHGRPATGLLYAATTLLAACTAIWVTTTLTRLAVLPRAHAERGQA